MTDINEILKAIEGRLDIREVQKEWNQLKQFAEWDNTNKKLLERAIELHQKRSDLGSMSGLCLAAYIMGWYDLLERWQEKDILDDWSELSYSFYGKESSDDTV